MSGRHRARLPTGLAVGLAVVVPGAAAHALAGGSLALWPAALAVAAVAAVATAIGPHVRWTFPRLGALALAAQPLLHRVFATGHGAHPAGRSDGAHAGAGHAAGTAAESSHTGMWMAVAHVAVALAVAVLLRWGVRWLRTMPTLVRALVVARRGPALPVAGRPYFAIPKPDARRPHLTVLAARGSRGPPC